MPWASIIAVALKLIEWLFNRSKISAEQKKAFMDFYNSYKKQGNLSAQQRDDVSEQLKDLESKK